MAAPDRSKHDEEDEYDSSADEDFNPDSAEARQAAELSSSDSDNEGKSVNRRPRIRPDVEERLDFENSGDEATIQSGQRKKRRRSPDPKEEDEGGEGGLIKTRAQKEAQKLEEKSKHSIQKSNLDVDSIWAQMSGTSTMTHVPVTDNISPTKPVQAQSTMQAALGSEPSSRQSETHLGYSEPTITIKRQITFAGQTTEEERQVPASSAEAKLYLEAQQMNNGKHELPAGPKPGLRRPTKRKSVFDQEAGGVSPVAKASGQKLNTVEKSKLDWAAHVDREGIAEELDVSSKGKTNYLGRQEFLGRMDAKRGNV